MDSYEEILTFLRGIIYYYNNRTSKFNTLITVNGHFLQNYSKPSIYRASIYRVFDLLCLISILQFATLTS